MPTFNAFPHNPRKLTDKDREALKASLIELGDLSGIVHNSTTGNIVSGNQRSDIFDIAHCDITIQEEYDKPDKQGTTALGYIIWQGNKYSYRRVKWGKLKERKANILANKLGGEFDNKLLKEFWSDLPLLDWGFKKNEIPWISEQDGSAAELTNSRYIDDGPPVELGDLFEFTIDNRTHRLMNGMSDNDEHVAKLFENRMADLVVTDPPYNVAYDKSPDHIVLNDDLPEAEFDTLIDNFVRNYASRTKKGATWYVWFSIMHIHVLMTAMKKHKMHTAQVLTWVKDRFIPSRSDYHWQTEHCLHALYGWKEGAAHTFNNDRKQSTLIIGPNPTKSPLHATQKPVELIALQVKNSSNADELVADAFMGSGTTMITCHQLNRDSIGMELDPNHVNTIIYQMFELENAFKLTKNGEDVTEQYQEHISKKQPLERMRSKK